MLEKALILAAKAHTGQVDKGGAPYILHPIRVMLACEGEKEKSLPFCMILWRIPL